MNPVKVEGRSSRWEGGKGWRAPEELKNGILLGLPMANSFGTFAS